MTIIWMAKNGINKNCFFNIVVYYKTLPNKQSMNYTELDTKILRDRQNVLFNRDKIAYLFCRR